MTLVAPPLPPHSPTCLARGLQGRSKRAQPRSHPNRSVKRSHRQQTHEANYYPQCHLLRAPKVVDDSRLLFASQPTSQAWCLRPLSLSFTTIQQQAFSLAFLAWRRALSSYPLGHGDTSAVKPVLVYHQNVHCNTLTPRCCYGYLCIETADQFSITRKQR